MIRVGITGQAGFMGTHLYNHLGLDSQRYERVPFEDALFDDMAALGRFVAGCDVIVHLAAVNRHESQQMLYDTNIRLVASLIEAMQSQGVAPQIIMSSSTQEQSDNAYGRSKMEGREMFERWAESCGASFTGLVVPNVFGEFSRPNYNTFVATFAHKLVCGEQPQVMVDSEVKLIYVASLCRFIMAQIGQQGIGKLDVPHDFQMGVSQVLALFNRYKEQYFDQGIIPELKGEAEINLFNTFRSYIAPRAVELVQHSDPRGVFVETLRLGVGGQVSFSTTAVGVTRGNHFHTRKIERFTVIKGKALIELRRVGTDEVLKFYLDGEQPAYVDMPVWYTHNIKNIGQDELYTQFWINEWYNAADGDTYFEEV